MPTPYIPLTICAGEWVAVRNDGGDWTRLEGQGRYSFLATDRVAIADVNHTESVTSVYVRYLGALEVTRYYRCGSSAALQPAASVRGVAAGLRAGEYTNISYGHASALASSTDAAFLLPTLNNADLIAVHLHPDTGLGRLIARRALTLTPNDSVILDWNSSEPFAPATSALRWTGGRGWLQVNLRTATGNDLVIQSEAVGQGTAEGAQEARIKALPNAKGVASDAYVALFGMNYGAADQRTLRFAYRTLRDMSVRFGAAVNAPTFTRTPRQGGIGLRIQVPSQPDYDGSLSFLLQQDLTNAAGSVSRLYVWLSATNAYYGGVPASWTLELPELSALSGFSSYQKLQDAPFSWNLSGANLANVAPDSALAEGVEARVATRSGTSR